MPMRFGTFIATSLMAVSLMLSGCFCGSGLGLDQTEVSLYLVDSATGAPVRAPGFTEEGQTLNARCYDLDAHDSSLCTSQVLTLDAGLHTIQVSAAGYAPETVQIDTQDANSAHLAVHMHAMP